MKIINKLVIFILIFVLKTELFSQVIYNAYANVTNISGATFTVNNVNEVNHTFINGEQVIIMQMQDNVIGTNTTNVATFGNLGSIQRAGLWEVATIISQTRALGVLQTVTFSGGLTNTYNTGPNSSLQIITLRRLSAAAFTTTNSITGLAWNGTIGGVIAFEVGTTLTLNHNVTANGIGFRGGVRSNNYYGGGTTCTLIDYATSSTNCGFKGEGIYKSTNLNFVNGIAKILNGGGGGGQDVNGGGGGGSNFTAGGLGGIGWNGTASGCPVATSPAGLGGISLSSQISSNRIFMGGGGGGGQQNDNLGSNGGNGGGVILIRANQIITNGVCGSPQLITANGQSALNAGNDGAGGGGAAGSIVLQVNAFSVINTCSLNITANGGNGGTVNSSTHAGGGAGAQGVVIFSAAQPTNNISTTTNNGSPGCNNSNLPCTSLAGSASGTNNSGIFSGLNVPLPIELLSFDVQDGKRDVLISWATANEVNTDYFIIERTVDMQNWEFISKLKAAENSHAKLYYETLDRNPLKGISYYRLKTIDKDKSISTSSARLVNRNESDNFVIFYPNPSNGILNMSSSYNTNQLKYKIIDITGKELFVNVVSQGDDKTVLDFSNLAKGLYFIEVIAPDGTEYKSNRVVLK